ncbi:MAG: hypothetical protein KC478_04670 [Bacteriovoracaceae bacterium]|nr:hypothetical protein [Bacteriovoracaceae bacterium]
MKVILGLLAFLILVSCGKNTEEYLYDKNHRDWQMVQQRASETCINESRIFQEMQKRNDFTSSFKENSYFQIDITKSNGAKYQEFIRINEVSSNSLVIHKYSEEEDSQSIVYTTKNNNDMISAIANGVCQSDDDFTYAHDSSALDNTTVLDFSDTRIDGDEQQYQKVTELYSAKVSFPLIFMQWNRKETIQYKDLNRSASEAKSNSYSVKSITKAACEVSEICNRSVWNFKRVHVSVNPSAYQSNDLNSRMFTIDATEISLE